MSDLIARARSQSLGDLLRRAAARAPEKLAVIDGFTQFTYAELDRAANRTANALALRGIAQGERVALLSRNCWEYVVLSFALTRLGAIFVPINFMLGPGEVAWILEHSASSGLVCEDDFYSTARGALELAEVEIRTLGWISRTDAPTPPMWEPFSAWAQHDDHCEPGAVIADDDPLRLMYTSGTESRPKGVMHSSRTLIAQYVSCIINGGMSSDDIDVIALPLYHCAALDCFLGPNIYLGATSVILPGPVPELVLATIEQHRATKFFAPPTVWISLLQSSAFDSTDLSSLTKGYYGASAMPAEVLGEIQKRLPSLRLWNFYGQTELAPLATVLTPDEQTAHPGSAGRPVINVETRVVDDEGVEVARGEIGEIVHRSPQVTGGYWLDPERTAQAFGGGWFHSGDLGVLDADGRLMVVDRKKDMIKTGGENVASREVEETIYAHPGVAEAAVFGVSDPFWVEAVTAAVVPREGVELTEEDIVRHCRASLAGYKTPKRVFVLDALPKNPSGKILKRELRKRFDQTGEKLVG